LCSASLEAFFNLDFEGIRGQFKEDWTENPDRQDWVAWEDAAPGWRHSPGNDTQGVYFNLTHYGTTQKFTLLNNYNPYEREYLENYGELPPGTPTFWQGNFRLSMNSGFLSPHEDEAGYNVPQHAWISQEGTIEAEMKSIHMKAEVWGVLGVWIDGVEIQMTETTTNVWVGDISAYAGQTVELKIGDNSPLDEYGELQGTGFGLDAVRLSTEAAVPEPAAFALCAGAIALLGLIARRRRQRRSLSGSSCLRASV
jgi:hypothetical protein